jgi:uncharacterized protein YjbK
VTTETIDEHELKLRLPDEAAAMRLAALLGTPRTVLEQCNTYFDSRESTVARSGKMMIRVRSCESHYEVTIKDRAIVDRDQGSLSSRERNSTISVIQGESVISGSNALTTLDNELCRQLFKELGEHLFAVGQIHNTRQVYDLPDNYVLELDRSELPNGLVEFEIEMELRSENHSLAEARQRAELLFSQIGITDVEPSHPRYHRFLAALSNP